jgi:hypothetical protein
MKFIQLLDMKKNKYSLFFTDLSVLLGIKDVALFAGLWGGLN